MIDDKKKKKAPQPPPDDIDREMRSLGLLRDEKTGGISKVRSAAERLRVLKIDVPDDVTDDFDKVTGLESGRSHFNKDGSVKRGVPTADGSRAIGYGQIMPGTAKPYQDKYGLDPEKEDDNIAMSLAEYHRGGSDPVSRRLAYVGGPKSPAVKKYKETGEISNGKLYSYLPKNKETYRSYVERSGGLDAPKDKKPAFDFDTFAAELLGDKKPTKDIPGPESSAPTFPGDGPGILPPGQPFYADDEEKRTGIAPGTRKRDLSQMTPEELDAERIKNGVMATPGAKGYKYQFEVDGKLGNPDLKYTGSFNDRYFAKDGDGNDWELDTLAGSWKSTKPLPFKLKMQDGTELVEESANPDGSKVLRDKKGEKWTATENERTKDENGNESVSYALKQEGSPQASPSGKAAAGGRIALKGRESTSSEVLEESKSYEFEKTGRLKLAGGTELGLVTDAQDVPEGKNRFRDADGETYLFDRESGRLEDESLKQVGAHIPVSRSPITDSLDVAKKFRARQVAATIAAQYGIDIEDVEAFTLQSGFSEPGDPNKPLAQDRYYKDRSHIVDVPGADKPDDFHQLTRRDLRDTVRFGQEQKQKRIGAVREMIAQGEQPSPELLRKMRITQADIDANFEDMQMAAAQGQVAKAQLDQLVPRFKAQGQDDYQARVNAKRAMGFISGKEAAADLEAWDKTLAEKRDRTATLNVGAQREHAQFVNIDALREDQAQIQATDAARRYGSALGYQRAKDAEAAAERARLERIEALPFIDKWGDRILGAPVRVGRGAINTLIAESLRGAVVYSKPVYDWLLENTSLVSGGWEKADDHAFFKAGDTVEKYVNWALKTNKDIDQEFLAGKFPAVVGTSLAMMLPSLSKNPRAMIALWSTLQMGGGSYKEAREAGASEEDALKFAVLNSGLFGWTEILGIGKALIRLKQLGGGAYKQFFQKLAKSAPNEIVEEMALNEGPQTIGVNMLAKVFYDPEREWHKGLGENLLLAGLAGGTVSTLVTAAGTAIDQRAIRTQIENDAAHGLPQFRNFKEAGVYIYGQPAQVHPDMEPLIARHAANADYIRSAQADIRSLREKAAATENVTERLNIFRAVRSVQDQIGEMYAEQTVTAREIIQLSGVPAPEPIDLRDQWEDAANFSQENLSETETPQTEISDSPESSLNGFDATLSDGRRVKVIEDRGSHLKVEDERGRITLQPTRKFQDLDQFRANAQKSPTSEAPETQAETPAVEQSPQDSAEFVHERDVTLQAQRDAMMDAKTSGAMGVLYTDPGSAPKIDGDKRLARFTLPDGELQVNVEKFKAKFGSHPALKRLEIESGTIPHEELIGGKAVPDRDTTKGTAVVTVDANGNELNSSKISDKPVEEWTAEDHANAAKQIDLDKQRFGDQAASSGIADTEEIVSSRQEDRPIDTKGFEITGNGKPKAQGLASLAEKRKTAQNEAYTNPMTGLGNAKAKALAQDRDATRKKPHWWAALDFNGTKGINDTFGHAFTDELFKEVAEAKRKAAAELGIGDRGLFHQSGDEFAATGEGDVSVGQKYVDLVEKYYGVRIHEKDGKTYLSSISGTVAENYDEADSQNTARKTRHKIAQSKAFGTEHPKDREGKPLVDPDATEAPAGKRNRAVIEPPKAPAAPTREKTGLEKFEERKLANLGFGSAERDALTPEERRRILALRMTRRDFFRKTAKTIQPVTLEKPLRVEISRSVRSRLRKKNTVRRLHKLGYAFTVGTKEAKITGIPPGMSEGEVAGNFETTVFNVDEERRSKVGKGNIDNLRSLTKASLAQFVRASGGIRPDTTDIRRGKISGELARLSKKEGFAGLVNQNSTYNAEAMAVHAWEMGYLRDAFPQVEDVNGEEFLGYVEDDAAVMEDEVARMERENTVHQVLASLTDEEFAYTQQLSRLLNDAEVFPIIEKASFTGEFSPEEISKIAHIGLNYELQEHETETALEALTETFGRWNGQETADQEGLAERDVEDYLISGFGHQGDPFEAVPIFRLEEPEGPHLDELPDYNTDLSEIFPNEEAASIEELEARAIAEANSEQTVEEETAPDDKILATLSNYGGWDTGGNFLPKNGITEDEIEDAFERLDEFDGDVSQRTEFQIESAEIALSGKLDEIRNADDVDAGLRDAIESLPRRIEPIDNPGARLRKGDFFISDGRLLYLHGIRPDGRVHYGTEYDPESEFEKDRYVGPQTFEEETGYRVVEKAPLAGTKPEALTTEPETVRDLLEVAAGSEIGDVLLDPESSAYLKAYDEDPSAFGQKARIDQAPDVDESVFDPVDIDAAAHEAATSPHNDRPEPTEAQKEAGNYKKGHIRVSGIDITVENPAGSERSGVDSDGKDWSVTMAHHYGYIKRTKGADEEQIDVFLKADLADRSYATIFVIDQVDPETREFDEHKVMIGFDTLPEAINAYKSNYAEGWQGLDAVRPMTLEAFKAWIGEEQTKPAAAEKPQDKLFAAQREAATKFKVGDRVLKGKSPGEISEITPRGQIVVKFDDGTEKRLSGEALTKAEAPAEFSDIDIAKAQEALFSFKDKPAAIDPVANGFSKSISSLIRVGEAAELPIKTDAGRDKASRLTTAAIESLLESGRIETAEVSGFAGIKETVYKFVEKKAEAVEPTVEPEAPKFGETNTVFTEDKAEAARKLLREKLKGNQHNIGLDPEVVKAGIDLAGYYIEGGARKFADYMAKMLEDLGSDVRPYLKQWYFAVQFDPSASGFASEMDDMATVDAALTPPAAKPPTLEDLRGTRGEQAGLFGAGDTGLFGEQGTMEAPPKPDTSKADQLATLSDRKNAEEEAKNIDIFGDDLGDRINELARRTQNAQPKTKFAIATISLLYERRNLAAAGEAGQDLAADTVTAIDEIAEAEIRGLSYSDYIRQSWIGRDELTPRQQDIYGKIATSPNFHTWLSSEVAKLNDQSQPESGERDSEGRPDVGSLASAPDTGDDGRDQPGSRSGNEPAAESGSGSDGRSGLFEGGTAAIRSESVQPVREQASGVSESDAGDDWDQGSGTDGDSGTLFESGPDDQTLQLARQRSKGLEARKAAQVAAEGLPSIDGDLDNIRATLPVLLPEQQEDVQFAEKRFAAPHGHGVLFTNGTGTGKTFTGLGIAKRFHRAGKRNILFVAPNDKIIEDWIAAGTALRLPIKRLRDKLDNGKIGPVMTTYANFRDNPELVNRNWDLIITDEAHNIMSSKDADTTAAVSMLRAVAVHPRGAIDYANQKDRETFDRLGALTAEERELLNRSHTNTNRLRLEEIRAEREEILPGFRERQEASKAEFKKKIESGKRPKLVFLSATPFAYEKNIDYAEGFLFSYGPEVDSGGYNSGDAYERFMMSHFGYRMRYNKLTKPDKDVNTELMEIEFNKMLHGSGALSGRTLQIDQDYGRQFVLVESAIGNKIDEGFEFVHQKSFDQSLPQAERHEWSSLYTVLTKQFAYLAKRYTLEAINARNAVKIVREHLALGRKVAIYHDYNKSEAVHPFQPERLQIATPDYVYDAEEIYEKFKELRPDLVDLDLSSLERPINVFRREFSTQVGFFNGLPEYKKTRLDVIRDFNSDGGKIKVLVAQSAAGREGISLHDTTGKHQRVLINLGLPERPTAAIQTEGRIYRVGNQSDAIQLYMTTGTWFERYAFATKISQRSSTAENLAMGEMARAIKQAFIDGYETADTNYTPNADEGIGGKAADKRMAELMTEWDRAKGFYYGQGKKTSRNKSAEGKDYFATPEPVGMKMVEWADQRFMESTIEPSAGHGAIARWFRSDNNKLLVEPSTELASRAALVSDGRLEQRMWEDISEGANKADTIVMNPPYGSGGSTAVKHLAKAAKHLHWNGRIVALIPSGPAADKAFEKWYESDEAKHVYMVGEVKLPSSTFNRAATSVMTRIVVLDRVAVSTDAAEMQRYDLTDAADINELFDRMEDLDMEPRKKADQPDPVVDAPSDAAPTPLASAGDDSNFDTAEFQHTRDGYTVFVAKFKSQVERETYNRINALAKAHGGYYSKYSGNGAIPGFAFKSAEQRAKFVNEGDAGGPLRSVVTSSPAAFYSQVERAIEAKMPNKASAEQIRGILANNSTTAEEKKWLGIDQYLATKPTFTKAEVLAFVRENTVQVEEKTLGTPQPRDERAPASEVDPVAENRVEAAREALVDLFDLEPWYDLFLEGEEGYRGGDRQDAINRFADRAEQDDDFTETLSAFFTPTEGDLYFGLKERHFAELENAYESYRDQARELREGDDEVSQGMNQYNDPRWRLPGPHSNYREHLFKLPRIPRPEQSIEWTGPVEREMNLELGGGFGGRKVVMAKEWTGTTVDREEYLIVFNPHKEKYVASGGHGYNLQNAHLDSLEEAKAMVADRSRPYAITDYDTSREFTGSHFRDEPNLVFWTRTTDRVDADGKKVLVIEEVQSDWHQQGREKGYLDPDAVAEMENHIAAAKAEVEAAVADAKPFTERMQDAPIAIIDRHTTATNRVRSLEHAMGEMKRNRIPDAPFKRFWELAFKQMLRRAAEGGYDRIAWTTGDQQNERWSLSNFVESISWQPRTIHPTIELDKEIIDVDIQTHQRGSFGLDVQLDGTVTNGPMEFRGKHLSEVIGKERANQILDPNAAIGHLRFDGEETLDLGGEGMRKSYDEIIPNFVRKYVKQWGGAIGTVEIPNRAILNLPEDQRQRMQAETEEAAQAAGLRANTDYVSIHSVDITAEMRDSVLAGQPLFKKRSKDSAELMADVLPHAHTQEIFEGIESKFEGEDLFINEFASEQLRRLLGTENFNFSGAEREESTFDGATLGAGQLRSLAALGRELRNDYMAVGYTDAHLAKYDEFLANLDELGAKIDFGVVFTFDDVLPEEYFHQEDKRAGRTDAIAIATMKKTAIWQNPGKRFTDEYPDLTDADKASELAAKLATDQAAKYGWSSLPDFEQAKKDFLATWAHGVFRRNATVIESEGVDAFIKKFRRIGFHAGLTETDTSSVRKTPPRGRSGREQTKRTPRSKATASDSKAAGKTSRPDRSAEEIESVKIDELDAAALGVTVGEVRVKNRRFARSLRESGRDATDVPYVPESEIGWIEDAKSILAESITRADASDFVQHDYSHALDVFEAKDTPSSTKVVLGIALIDHLGAMGDYAMMLRVGEMTTKIVGTAAQALRASQLVSKYDFAHGVELARKALEKRGKELSPKQIDKIRELSRLYNASVREKAMTEQTLRDAEEILKEQQESISDLQDALDEADGQKGVSQEILEEMEAAIRARDHEIRERDTAIEEHLGEITEAEDLIGNLKRQLDRWKTKINNQKAAVIRKSRTYKDLLDRKEAIRAALAEAFPGRPLKSVVGRPLKSVVASSADFDEATRALLVDYIALQIFEGESYDSAIDALQDLTNGILTETEIAAIHADAVDITSGEKVDRDPQASEKLKNRNEHKRKAKEFRTGPKESKTGKKASRTKADKLSRLEEEMLKLAAGDINLGIAAVFYNNSKNVEDFTRAMELAYPDLTKEQIDDLFVHARELRDRARKSVRKQIFETQNDAETTEEVRDDAREKLPFADRDIRNTGTSLDRHYKQLQKSTPTRVIEKVLAVLNIPKTLMSGGEVSYIGRQGFLPLVLFTRAGLRGLKGVAAGFRTEAGRLKYEAGLRMHRHFDRAQNAGTIFSQIGDFNLTDEHFNAGAIFKAAAESKHKALRVVGKTQQAFEHAYTLPGDAQRLFIVSQLFDLLDDQPDLPVHKREIAEKTAAKIANAFTGKSNLQIFKRDNLLTKFLTTLGFAPSYVGSRFEASFYLSPVGILTAPRGLRAMMAKKMLRFHSTMFALAMAAALVLDAEGDDDERSRWDIIDPSSKSFLKGRIRGTDLKFDLTANMSEPMRLLFYNAVGSAFFAATGQWNKLGDIWKQERERYIYTDMGEPLRYFRGKLSPFASFVYDIAAGKDYLGRQTRTSAGDVAVSASQRLWPLTYQQAIDALVSDQATELMRPGLGEAKLQQWENLKRGDLNFENAATVFMTSALGANFQDFAELEKSRAEVKAWDMWEGFTSKKKTPEEKAILAGVRRIYRFREEQLRDGKDTKVLDRRLAEILAKHGIDPKAAAGLKEQATGSRFQFVTKQFSEAQLRMLIDEYATTRERPELERYLQAAIDKKDKPANEPKTLQEKLHGSDVEEAVKLYREREAGMTPRQRLEAKNKLRSKAMNSNSRRSLAKDDYEAVKRILPNFPPHRPGARIKKPIKGLDSFKGVY